MARTGYKKYFYRIIFQTPQFNVVDIVYLGKPDSLIYPVQGVNRHMYRNFPGPAVIS